MTLINHLAFFTNTIGTGSITSTGPASPGYLDLSSVTVNGTFSYSITDGINWEYGNGTYNGTSMSRAVSTSSNANSAISLSGASALVCSTAIPGDFASGTGGGGGPTLNGSNAWTGPNIFSGVFSVSGSGTVGGTLTASTLASSGTASLVQLSGTGSPLGIYFGSGVPSAAFLPAQGSLFINTTAAAANTRFYIMDNIGKWEPFTAAG